MRALLTRFYQRGKGFSTNDLLALLREVGMPDVDGFYQRYINGREPLPYEAVLAKAGITPNRRTVATPFLGVNAPPNDRSEEHTSELQSQSNLVCRLLLEKKKN